MERHRLGDAALERPRQREIWIKQPHITLPRDVTKALCAAMMHMICWRGLRSNHRGLAVLTREYLNPPPTPIPSHPTHSHQHLSPLLASLRHVPGQTVNSIGEDLNEEFKCPFFITTKHKWFVPDRINKGITPTVNVARKRWKKTLKDFFFYSHTETVQPNTTSNCYLNPLKCLNCHLF